MERGYQYHFSELHQDAMYNKGIREKKAITMIKVLGEFFSVEKLPELTVLDVGSSTGIIDHYLSLHFKHVDGIDIDEQAIEYASKTLTSEHLTFKVGDAMNITFPDNSFDIVICAQIYEHVPDAQKMIKEIYRVLKPQGVCYFAAGNRFNIQEPHYNLPFLSVIPKPFAHLYLRLMKRGNFYYEQHLSYWGLKKLVESFQMIDFTSKMLHNPENYKIEYMLKPNSLKHKIAKFIVNNTYWFCPGYIWLLQKP